MERKRVFIEAAQTVEQEAGLRYTGAREALVASGTKLVELPESMYPQLGATAGEITHAVVQGLESTLESGTAEVSIRFGLSLTASLDVKLASAGAESVIEVEVKRTVTKAAPRSAVNRDMAE
jgi:hypothetical protein